MSTRVEPDLSTEDPQGPLTPAYAKVLALKRQPLLPVSSLPGSLGSSVSSLPQGQAFSKRNAQPINHQPNLVIHLSQVCLVLSVAVRRNNLSQRSDP
jgi:hypothetical protein